MQALQFKVSGSEIAFNLPHEKSGHFEALLTALEARKAELCVASFGMSVTSLEDVFIRVGTHQVRTPSRVHFDSSHA